MSTQWTPRGGVDPAEIATAVAAELGPDLITASEVESNVESGITNKVSDDTIPSKADVTGIPDAVTSALNTGSDTLSRVTASVASAIIDAVTFDTLPTKADVDDVTTQVTAAIDAAIDVRLRMESPSWGVQVTVTGATTEDLIPAPGDPSFWTELLGLCLSVSGATTVTMANGNSAFVHTFPGAASIWMNASDLTSLNGNNVLYRVGNLPITLSGNAALVTITATPRYRTNAI